MEKNYLPPMNGDIYNEIPANGDLWELYRLYATYRRELGHDRDLDYPTRDFEGFKKWWNQLSPASRRMCERNYRLGYANVLVTERAKIQAMLAQQGE